jgi:maleate isomerase
MNYRIGLLVPSSNVTVETELPQLLGRHPEARFSFHSSRLRMHSVTAEELAAMNTQRERGVDELLDAGIRALVYGCLVAVMSQGPGAHRAIEAAIAEQVVARGLDLPTLSSAGALVEGLRSLAAHRVAVVMPYLTPLARTVVAYLEAEGFDVRDWTALEEPDNAQVACIPAERIADAARGLDLRGADALVISACVQMPSLDLVPAIEAELQIPVLSATTATAHLLMRLLGLGAVVAGGGALLADHPAIAH